MVLSPWSLLLVPCHAAFAYSPFACSVLCVLSLVSSHMLWWSPLASDEGRRKKKPRGRWSEKLRLDFVCCLPCTALTAWLEAKSEECSECEDGKRQKAKGEEGEKRKEKRDKGRKKEKRGTSRAVAQGDRWKERTLIAKNSLIDLDLQSQLLSHRAHCTETHTTGRREKELAIRVSESNGKIALGSRFWVLGNRVTFVFFECTRAEKAGVGWFLSWIHWCERINQVSHCDLKHRYLS